MDCNYVMMETLQMEMVAVQLVKLKMDMFVQVFLRLVKTNVVTLSLIHNMDKFVIMVLVFNKMAALMIANQLISDGLVTLQMENRVSVLLFVEMVTKKVLKLNLVTVMMEILSRTMVAQQFVLSILGIHVEVIHMFVIQFVVMEGELDMKLEGIDVMTQTIKLAMDVKTAK